MQSNCKKNSENFQTENLIHSSLIDSAEERTFRAHEVAIGLRSGICRIVWMRNNYPIAIASGSKTGGTGPGHRRG